MNSNDKKVLSVWLAQKYTWPFYQKTGYWSRIQTIDDTSDKYDRAARKLSDMLDNKSYDEYLKAYNCIMKSRSYKVDNIKFWESADECTESLPRKKEWHLFKMREFIN